MSAATALARAQELKTALHDFGVTQVSIELLPGRPTTSADVWLNPHFFCTFGHHTAIPKSYRDAGKLTPSLAICKTGRVDVPGPLCQGYLGFDRVARILTLGLANHPGAGGPLTVAGRTIPKDGARPYGFGWEMEGGDYDWLDWQHDLMARCLGATQQFLGSPSEAHAEHRTWTSRKIDRFGYTAATAIAAITAVQNAAQRPPAHEELPDMIVGQDQFNGKIYLISGNTKLEFPSGPGPSNIYVDELLLMIRNAYPGTNPAFVALNHDIMDRIPDVLALVEPTEEPRPTDV